MFVNGGFKFFETRSIDEVKACPAITRIDLEARLWSCGRRTAFVDMEWNFLSEIVGIISLRTSEVGKTSVECISLYSIVEWITSTRKEILKRTLYLSNYGHPKLDEV